MTDFALPQPPNATNIINTDTVVIGAGQAGLAAAYYLQQRKVDFRLLDAAPTVGAAWAGRYDSLRLFSPAWASGLPGRLWPGRATRYPTRDETTAYLRDYAAHFKFPFGPNQRITRLAAHPGPEAGYAVHTAAGRIFRARRVIVATGPYTTPHVPAWATQLPAAVAQLHSREYRHPSQLPPGPVAVVGSGNSALQIAADVAATGRPVAVAFDEKTPALPNNQLMWAFLTLTGLMRVPRHTALGRWLHGRPEAVVSGDLAKLRALPGAEFIGRAVGALPTGALQGTGAASAPLAAVVWATGYRPDYGWIDLPIFAADGSPRHHRGLTAVPGVAFLGLDWLDSRRSALLNGAGADARRVVAALLR